MATNDGQPSPGGMAPGDGALQPDAAPAAGPLAKPGAPLSVALRQRAAELMAQGTEWMDENKLAVRWAALSVVAGGLAFMLHYGHLPGWRVYTSLAELPPRLLAPEARRLPVVLHSVAQRGEAVAVQAAHWPLLRRLADRYRGLTPAAAAARAVRRQELLTCHLAGPIQPTEAGMAYLQSLPRNSLHRLRLLSIIDAADQPWTTAGAAGPLSDGAQAQAAAPPPQLAAFSSAAAAGPNNAAAAGRLVEQVQQDQQQGQAGSALPQAGDPPAVLAAPRGDVLAPATSTAGISGSGTSSSSGGPGEPELLLWGELYSREPRKGLAALLPRGRADVGERLVRQGHAALMEPIDLEWLGVGWHRIDRLYAAEQAAIAQGLGMWAARRPGLGEWSRSLARSAWVRVRHAARTSAAAAASGLGGAAAAAGDKVGQATSAAAGSLTQAASSAGASVARAASAASQSASSATSAAAGGLARAAAAVRVPGAGGGGRDTASGGGSISRARVAAGRLWSRAADVVRRRADAKAPSKEEAPREEPPASPPAAH